jgi:hypothetical protein
MIAVSCLPYLTLVLIVINIAGAGWGPHSRAPMPMGGLQIVPIAAYAPLLWNDGSGICPGKRKACQRLEMKTNHQHFMESTD